MVRSNGDRTYERRVGFPPIAGDGPRVLILGTIPSVRSALKEQYYGNPRNQFWRMVHEMFGSSPSESYEARANFLRTNHIAIWDVLKECCIIDSKDSTIRDEVINDIQGFLEDHDSIVHVFLNGKKAYKHYLDTEVKVKGRSLPATCLPSSSPLHAIPYEKKLREWSVIRRVIDGSDPRSHP
jgi:hypoxanthine-DNA glycosylase